MPYLLIAYLTDCKLLPDLGLLRTLTGLTMLYIARFKLLSDLGPLAKLTGLTSLSISGCELVSDLSPLLDLSKLQDLHVFRTAVPLPDHLRDSSDASAIMAWYRENKQATGKRPLAEAKAA